MQSHIYIYICTFRRRMLYIISIDVAPTNTVIGLLTNNKHVGSLDTNVWLIICTVYGIEQQNIPRKHLVYINKQSQSTIHITSYKANKITLPKQVGFICKRALEKEELCTTDIMLDATRIWHRKLYVRDRPAFYTMVLTWKESDTDKRCSRFTLCRLFIVYPNCKEKINFIFLG